MAACCGEKMKKQEGPFSGLFLFLLVPPISHIIMLAVLLSLTGFGVYQAFGPPSKALDDPFDDHED